MTRRTNRRKRAATTRSTKRFSWKKATAKQRALAIGEGLAAVIAAIAAIVALVQYVNWRIAVNEARDAQNQIQSKYDFNPGNIISDGQFFNGNALSEAQIQSFLDEQGVSCSADNCLKSMTFDTESQPASEYCEAYESDGKESAATIIYKSGKACGISQKVLLTVLQKEQHLVSATDPSEFQFKSAMGLSCPDDASCDPEYAGFFKQVYGAAKRYQYYVHNESKYGYHDGTINYIQYNPDASCGGTDVYIENKATALLYIYTPYQPNTEALEAGSGEGNACSSYGNRNFSIIYSDWFGNPRN